MSFTGEGGHNEWAVPAVIHQGLNQASAVHRVPAFMAFSACLNEERVHHFMHFPIAVLSSKVIQLIDS